MRLESLRYHSTEISLPLGEQVTGHLLQLCACHCHQLSVLLSLKIRPGMEPVCTYAHNLHRRVNVHFYQKQYHYAYSHIDQHRALLQVVLSGNLLESPLNQLSY